jgi:hypothetical protein
MRSAGDGSTGKAWKAGFPALILGNSSERSRVPLKCRCEGKWPKTELETKSIVPVEGTPASVENLPGCRLYCAG